MSNDTIVVKSQGGLFPHTHTLTIPRAAILNPRAEGVSLRTSPEYSLIFKHSHEVKLTQLDLAKLRDGGEVIAYDADKGRHSFRISLAL